MKINKILVNETMEEEGLDLFRKEGIELDLEKKDSDELLEKISEYDALIVRSKTKVGPDIIEAGAKGNLKMIGRSGVGYDNVDVEFAEEHGIIVKNAPHGNTNATAEFAFGSMLSLARNIPQSYASLKDGKWLKSQYMGVELSHKTLGIFGYGRIGEQLHNLSRGFDMKVIVYDLFPKKDKGITYLSKEKVISNADFLSIHVGGDDVIIGQDELEQMKSTAYLINTARGNNVDPAALYDALKENKIAGAALDVHTVEGSSFKNKFEGLDNIVITPHLGASSKKAQRDTSIEMADVTLGYLLHGDFTNAVNGSETIGSKEKSDYRVFIHHQNIPGVFANIGKVFADYGINIKESNSIIPCNKKKKNEPEEEKKAITVYMLQNEVDNSVVKKLEAIPTVYSAKI